MKQISDYEFAKLQPELLKRIRDLETELSAELDEPIVLLALEEKEQSMNR